VKAHQLLVNEGDDKVPDLVVDGNAELHPSQYEPVLQFPATRAMPVTFKYTDKIT
jgi:hypothetical protein